MAGIENTVGNKTEKVFHQPAAKRRDVTDDEKRAYSRPENRLASLGSDVASFFLSALPLPFIPGGASSKGGAASITASSASLSPLLFPTASIIRAESSVSEKFLFSSLSPIFFHIADLCAASHLYIIREIR